MAYARIALATVGFLFLAGILAPASAAETSLLIPVKAVKAAPICRAVVRCAGCGPVYQCQACRKRPICTHGVCIYRTICGWGPALPALPKGARLVKPR